MQVIDCDNVEAYLRTTGRIAPGDMVRVRRLAGGVSNEVLCVERTAMPPKSEHLRAAVAFAPRRIAAPRAFVLKQARPQLRVADPWFCSVERIWREVETLRVCAAALEGANDAPAPDGFEVCVPQLLFEDRDNYLFAMTAAPPHEVWKTRLLAGHVEPAIAAACGRLLAALHAGTWRDGETATRLRDRSFFDDLRIDPYYRRVARIHDDLEGVFDDLIPSLAKNCLCLVHGDFSPKNLLIYGEDARPSGGLMLVDFEVGHYGDPAFDLGFFLSHLALKAFWSGPRFAEYFALTDAFWQTYRARMAQVASEDELQALTARAVRNFAGCLLARIDGKSKVEYITGESLSMKIRGHARRLLLDPPPAWDAVGAQLLGQDSA